MSESVEHVVIGVMTVVGASSLLGIWAWMRRYSPAKHIDRLEQIRDNVCRLHDRLDAEERVHKKLDEKLDTAAERIARLEGSCSAHQQPVDWSNWNRGGKPT